MSDDAYTMLGAVFGAVLVGATFGILPLAVGLAVSRRRDALAAFLGCILAGLVGGIFAAVPLAIITTVVILLLSLQRRQ